MESGQVQNEILREVLRNRGTLTQYLRGELPKFTEIERHLYVGVRERNPTRPDHLLKNRQRKEFEGVGNVHDLLLHTLGRLGKYYLTSSDSAPYYFVNSERYSEWQNLISEVSPLLIVSWKFSEDTLSEDTLSEDTLSEDTLSEDTLSEDTLREKQFDRQASTSPRLE